MRDLKGIRSWAGAAFASLFFTAPSAHATYTAYIYETGGNVVATGSGSINTAALTVSGPDGFFCNSNGLIMASFSTFCMLGSGKYAHGISGPANFGSGGAFFGNSVSGSGIGLDKSANNLYLPNSYTSGSNLPAATVTWNGKTLASLGATVGTYTWTWGSGATADSYVLIVGTAPPVVAAAPATVQTLNEYAIFILAGLVATGTIWSMKKRDDI